jgi:hypothetical protein
MKHRWTILLAAAISLCGLTADAQLKGTASIPVNIRWVTGVSDTLVTTDCFNYVHYSASTTVTVTVPSGLGAVCDVVLLQDGTGAVTPVPGAKVVKNTSPYGWTKTVGPNAALIIHYYTHGTATAFDLFGDGAK